MWKWLLRIWKLLNWQKINKNWYHKKVQDHQYTTFPRKTRCRLRFLYKRSSTNTSLSLPVYRLRINSFETHARSHKRTTWSFLTTTTLFRSSCKIWNNFLSRTQPLARRTLTRSTWTATLLHKTKWSRTGFFRLRTKFLNLNQTSKTRGWRKKKGTHLNRKK